MTKTKQVFRILIVVDEGDMCLVLEMILNKEEFFVEHVKRIAAAEQYLKSSVPDLILLDNRLPDGLGIDFIPFLKRFYPGVKVLMISARDGALMDLALDTGADLFLQKPFTRGELLDSVDRLLETKEALSPSL